LKLKQKIEDVVRPGNPGVIQAPESFLSRRDFQFSVSFLDGNKVKEVKNVELLAGSENEAWSKLPEAADKIATLLNCNSWSYNGIFTKQIRKTIT
jgi:hypothetical protein